jgi:ribosomal protein L12E/L44/L45/RPP1/RPP2
MDNLYIISIIFLKLFTTAGVEHSNLHRRKYVSLLVGEDGLDEIIQKPHKSKVDISRSTSRYAPKIVGLQLEEQKKKEGRADQDENMSGRDATKAQRTNDKLKAKTINSIQERKQEAKKRRKRGKEKTEKRPI